ncbi:MAG: YdbL family protein [Candidatus Omnitrophica bacterium]|nr:YdbL family protein [Candidatus Omnitrophota bacterium]
MKDLRSLAVIGLFLLIGCATVKVQAPKEPIKVDVTMRLDVYQHVQKDIDDIESIVTGGAGSSKGLLSLLEILETTAYAQSLDPEVESAALRRKARYSTLVSLESSGAVGEDNKGMVVVKGNADSSLVNEENADRMVIYKGIAAKNGTSVQEVQKVYAARLQQGAPAGTPIQAENGSWGKKS